MRTLYHDMTLARMTAEGVSYGLIEAAAILVENGHVVWTGLAADAPDAEETRSLEGRLVTPALIDCHTHLVHGGHRAREFEMRLEGATYEELARAGGGIVSTVTATRAASEDELVESALPRLDALLAEGVAVVEIKSGYGLDVETELRMLRAARRLGELRPARIVTSFLGAHAIPADYKGRADAYIDEVCIPALEAAAAEGLADAVDGFTETIGFTLPQMARVFDKAKALGLPIKLHAEQLSNMGGAAMAASRYGALSAEHLEYVDKDGVAALAKAGTVAVLLPGAFYTLRETQLPPIDLMREAGVAMAVSTDENPGSSPLTSLLLTMNMACTLFRMTPEEALAGTTRCAAKALGLQAEYGTLEPGKRAEMNVWDLEHPAELSYRIGFNPLHAVIREGALCPAA